MPLFIGIDAGGTTTEALAARTDEAGNLEQEWSHRGTGIQARRLSPPDVVDRVAVLIERLSREAPDAPLGGVVAGIAGAADIADDLTERLRQRIGSANVEIVHDGILALETAFGPSEGIAVVAGTGSVVLGRDADGQAHRMGGWGYRLGDEGSGYALGRAALRAVGDAMDGGPSTDLALSIEQSLGISNRKQLLAHVYDDNTPLSEAASLLIEASSQDTVARHILKDETEKLASLVSRMQTRTVLPSRAVLFGGLRHAPAYVSALQEALHAIDREWELHVASDDPVRGALKRALRLG